MTKVSAEELMNLGYVPVSVIPPGAELIPSSKIKTDVLGKTPGIQHADGRWHGYEWRKHIPTVEDAVEWDASGANIGILATHTPAFDIDVDDAELSEKIGQEILRLCGSAPVRSSRPPRSLLFYRIDKPLAKQKLKFSYKKEEYAVEFLGDGEQVVVAGTHPQGYPYSVSHIIPHDELVCLTPELVTEAFEAIKHLIEDMGGEITSAVTKKAKMSTINHLSLDSLVAPHKVDLSDQKIKEIVESLDPDMNYDNWLKVGMGLHAQYDGSEVGFFVWDLWSRRGTKYKPGETEAKWASFNNRKGGVGFASVIQLSNAGDKLNVANESTAAIKIPPTTSLPLKPKSALDLINKPFKKLQWTIPDILPEGCYLLVAKPKIGKSWLALQLCCAVVSGATVFDKQIEKGKALYLALEDNERRLQSRLHILGRSFNYDLSLLSYEVEWKRDNEGGAKAIRVWLKQNSEAKLIVVDTLQAFRKQRNIQKNGVYEEDYTALQNLKRLSDEFQVTILVVHHSRKENGKTDDPHENISGSNGLLGAADGGLVLEKKGAAITMHLKGRDIVDETSFALTFNRDNCLWTCQGDAQQFFMADNKRKILEAIKASEGGAKATDIQLETGINASTIRGILASMAKEGTLVPLKRGLYSLPDPLDLDNSVVMAGVIQQHNKQTIQQDTCN